MSKHTKRDIILILALVLLASMFALLLTPRSIGTTVQISVDGRAVAIFPLHTDQTVSIPGVGGENLLVIENGYARIEEADCPDHLCEKMPKISHVGETIVCLPHRVVISILSLEEHADTILWVSHKQEVVR